MTRSPGYVSYRLGLFREMSEKCRVNGIRLILCSVTPAPHDPKVGRDYRNFYIDSLNAGFVAVRRREF